MTTRALGAAAIALGAGLALFAAYVFYAALPGRGDGLPLPGAGGRLANKVVPQGWAFFTADGQATAYVAYRQQDGEWTPASNGPLASAANGWGFGRSPRLQDQQVQSVVAGIASRYWHDCTPDLALAEVGSCLDENTTGVYAANPYPVPALCGPVAIVAARPVPWADARSDGAALNAARVLNMDLKC